MKASAVNRRVGACAALLGVAVWCLAPAPLRAQRYSRPIEFSGPSDRSINTNLDAARLKSPDDRASWLKLDESPFHSGGLFDSGGSLQGVVAPVYLSPALSPAQRKRLKDQEDRRKNWEFAQPDDAADLPTAEDTLNLSEYDASGRKKKSGTVLERYIESLDPSRKQSRERPIDPDRFSDNKRPSVLDDRLRRDGSPLNGGIGNWLPSGTGPDAAAPLPGADNADSVMLFERTRTLKARLSEFHQLLDSGPALGSASGTAGGFTPSAAALPLQPTFGLPATPGFASPGASGLAGPASVTFPTVNSQPFGQSSPAYNAPAAGAAAGYPPPTFAVPVRKF